MYNDSHVHQFICTMIDIYNVSQKQQLNGLYRQNVHTHTHTDIYIPIHMYNVSQKLSYTLVHLLTE